MQLYLPFLGRVCLTYAYTPLGGQQPWVAKPHGWHAHAGGLGTAARLNYFALRAARKEGHKPWVAKPHGRHVLRAARKASPRFPYWLESRKLGTILLKFTCFRAEKPLPGGRGVQERASLFCVLVLGDL